MKKSILLVLFVASALIAPRLALAQGSLTPPGAPAPTMKTLDQIEARTPLAAATSTVTISQSGSYYLTGNIEVTSGDAITITADNVSLDLNGFTLSSTSPSPIGNGISVDGRTNISIFNGSIRSASTVSGNSIIPGPGFQGGINYNSPPPSNIHVSNVSVVGVSYYPIDLGTDGTSVVQGCTVRIAQGYGISAGTVSDSSAVQCSNALPIVATTINNCVGSPYNTGTLAILDSSSTAALQTSLNTANTGINTANSGISTANTNIAATNSGISTANSGISAANTGITSANSGIATANAGIATANTNINTANSGITTANTGIATANTNINTANSRINTANSGITDANTGITTANAGITSLLGAADKRIAIPSAVIGLTPPYNITSPGSYYLAANINVTTGNAITINASNVVLDLNGFAISSTASPASGSGISITATRQNITIRNGTISGTTTLSGATFTPGGFTTGILASSGNLNIAVEKVQVRNIAGDGIYLTGALGTSVSFCNTNITSGFGILAASISDSNVESSGGSYAIGGLIIARCRATNVSTSASSFAIYGAVISDSIGSGSSGSGVRATDTAINCQGTSQGGGTGIYGDCLENCSGTSVSSNGVVAFKNALNCVGISTSSTGLSTNQATNCYGESTSGTGILGVAVTNCTGKTAGTSASSYGISAPSGIISTSRGIGGGGTSVALLATIAIGCTGTNGTITVTNKYNMP